MCHELDKQLVEMQQKSFTKDLKITKLVLIFFLWLRSI